MNIFLFFLSMLGLTFILTHSKIGVFFRNGTSGLIGIPLCMIYGWDNSEKIEDTVDYFVSCPQCVGFWIGLWFGWWCYTYYPLSYGLSVSFLCFIVNAFLKVLILLEVLVRDNIE